MKSIGTMIKQLAALDGLEDLTSWEMEFSRDIWHKTSEGRVTSGLSDRQVEAIERIFNKHFAG
jgi:hypothetical protein